jgi:LPXTG-site transpeptidase (sortase) family protein
MFLQSSVNVDQKGEPLITYSTETPDESKQNADSYDWKGISEEPKSIRIPKIGVTAYVQKAGIDQHRKVAVPTNIHLTGWFNEGVRPGEPGLSIISGHVSGPNNDGVFKNLKKLNMGDRFEVERGDGLLLEYKVVDKVEVEESRAANYLFSQNLDIKSQLNLITCGGFDENRRKYLNRVILVSELL